MRKIGIHLWDGEFVSSGPGGPHQLDGRAKASAPSTSTVGGVKMAEPCGYRVIVDRISHDIPFYRAYLKNAVLSGTMVINNPFWWSADDNSSTTRWPRKLGVAIPHTVLLPHKSHPPGTTDQSMRNLKYPLNWDEIFDYIGFPAFLKPYSGGGWKSVYKVTFAGGVLRGLRRDRRPLHDAADRASNFRNISAATWSGRRRCISCTTIRARRTQHRYVPESRPGSNRAV